MIADLCSELWKRNCHVSLQVFNSEVDNAGFDLVLKLGESIRYVQIKQTHDQKKLSHCSTRVPFSKLNGSCVVLISYKREDLTISGYKFYGKFPHEPMEPIEAFSASKTPGRRNAEGERHIRSHYRNVPVKQFAVSVNCEELLDFLFPSYLQKSVILDDPLLALQGTWPGDGETADEYVQGLRDGWGDEEFEQ
jgi:hypothetical protein